MSFQPSEPVNGTPMPSLGKGFQRREVPGEMATTAAGPAKANWRIVYAGRLSLLGRKSRIRGDKDTMASDRRILVTGATGMVGRHLVRRLLEEGHRPTLALRSPPGPGFDDPRLRIVITGHLETSARLDDAIEGADRIVHCAGFAHVLKAARGDERSPAMRANADATARLCEAAACHGVSAFVHLSSVAAVAGNTASDILSDRTPPQPESEYGRSKLAAEGHVEALVGKGCLAVSLRPPLILGAKARGNLALLCRAAASPLPLPFGGLDARRSLIGLDTLCDAILACLTFAGDAERSGAYLVAERDPLSLRAIVAELRAGMGRRPRLFPIPKPALALVGRMLGRTGQMTALTHPLVLDASNFEAAFGFRPRGSARAALRAIGRETAHERMAKD